MSLNIDIYNASFFLQLDVTTDYGFAYGASLGVPESERVFSRPWGRGFSPLVGVNVGNRTAQFTVRLRGTSLDNWIVNYRQLREILRDAERYNESDGVDGDRAYLSVQLNGMTYPTEFDIISGDFDAGDAIGSHSMTRTSAPILVEAALSLVLKPFGRPQALVSSASGNLTNGSSSYTVSAPAGDREAPARMRLASGASPSGIRVIMARRTRGNVANFIYTIECETGTYSNFIVSDAETSANFSLSNVADAAMSGGSKLRLAHTATGTDADADIIAAVITDNIPDFFGKFRVLLRFAGAVSATNVTHLGITSRMGGTGASSSVDNTLFALSGSYVAGDTIDLGVVTLPVSETAPTGAHSGGSLPALWLRGSFANAAFNLDLDCIYLVPVDEQIIDVQTAAGNEIAILESDDLEGYHRLYTLQTTTFDSDNTQLKVNADSGISLKPGVANLFICWTFNGATTTKVGNLDLTVVTNTIKLDYFPLYEQAR